MTRIALDSNILVYLAGGRVAPADDAKIERTRTDVKRLRTKAELVAPVQALGETFVVLRRSGIAASEARAVVIELAQGLATAGSSESTLNAALDLVAEHKLQFWDAMIVSAAAETGCSLLLSEDMQDGFVVRGLTIANPLTDRPHQKLARLLA